MLFLIFVEGSIGRLLERETLDELMVHFKWPVRRTLQSDDITNALILFLDFFVETPRIRLHDMLTKIGSLLTKKRKPSRDNPLLQKKRKQTSIVGFFESAPLA